MSTWWRLEPVDTRLHLAHHEHVVDELEQPLSAAADDLDARAQLGCQDRAPLEELGVAEDGVHRRPESRATCWRGRRSWPGSPRRRRRSRAGGPPPRACAAWRRARTSRSACRRLRRAARRRARRGSVCHPDARGRLRPRSTRPFPPGAWPPRRRTACRALRGPRGPSPPAPRRCSRASSPRPRSPPQSCLRPGGGGGSPRLLSRRAGGTARRSRRGRLRRAAGRPAWTRRLPGTRGCVGASPCSTDVSARHEARSTLPTGEGGGCRNDPMPLTPVTGRKEEKAHEPEWTRLQSCPNPGEKASARERSRGASTRHAAC